MNTMKQIFGTWKAVKLLNIDLDADEWNEKRDYYIDMLNADEYCNAVKFKIIKNWHIKYDHEYGFYY